MVDPTDNRQKTTDHIQQKIYHRHVVPSRASIPSNARRAISKSAFLRHKNFSVSGSKDANLKLVGADPSIKLADGSKCFAFLEMEVRT